MEFRYLSTERGEEYLDLKRRKWIGRREITKRSYEMEPTRKKKTRQT